MSMRHVRNLKMDEEILCVKYSNNPSKDPRKTLVAVATLDNTVKIYFDDSLKFFLSMYVLFFSLHAADTGTCIVVQPDDNQLIVSSVLVFNSLSFLNTTTTATTDNHRHHNLSYTGTGTNCR